MSLCYETVGDRSAALESNPVGGQTIFDGFTTSKIAININAAELNAAQIAFNRNLETIAYSVLIEQKLFKNAAFEIEELSNIVGISSDLLTSAIKEHSGRSFREFVNDARIATAKELVEWTGLSILEIAIESGFKSEQDFIRCFEMRVGLTIREFKLSLSGRFS